jgi:death on curing protein
MTEAPWPDPLDLLRLLAPATGPGGNVRDGSILVAAAIRPNAAILNTLVFPTLLEKSAALLHAVMMWRPLQLWNAGLAWAAALGMLMRNGFDLEITAWEQMAITDEIASGRLDEVAEIVERLQPYLRTR